MTEYTYRGKLELEVKDSTNPVCASPPRKSPTPELPVAIHLDDVDYTHPIWEQTRHKTTRRAKSMQTTGTRITRKNITQFRSMVRKRAPVHFDDYASESVTDVTMVHCRHFTKSCHVYISVKALN